MVRRLLLAASLCALLAPATARAKDTQPISLSLVTPIQIVPASQGIEGFRLNLLYGRNASLTGLDIGLANHVTGRSLGVEWGLVGLADSDFTGLQWNVVTITQGHMEGAQLGFYNYAASVKGLQLGILNHAGRIEGIQIGLVNIIEKGGWLPVMVLVNGSFRIESTSGK
jgi:hypothetical protein